MTDNLGRTALKNERVDLFDCPTANFCLNSALTPRLTVFTDETGRFTFEVPIEIVRRKRYVLVQAIFGAVKCRFLLTPTDLRIRSGGFGSGGAAQEGELDLVLDPIAEAASRLLAAAGASNYSDESIEEIRQRVIAANAEANFAGLSVEAANDQAEVTAAADAAVQSILDEDRRTPTPIYCVGDCDLNDVVTVDDIVRGVAIVRGSLPLEFCPEFDADASLDVTLGELRDAVSRALGGC
jgi:hypothetical protein